MKIVVCIKQVPDTVEVKIDPKTGTLIRDGVPSIINHDDKTGIEAALTIREQVGGTVTVVSMGPPQADVALSAAEDHVTVKRQFEDGYHIVKVKTPCLLTAIAELAEPRYMSVGGVFDAYQKEIKIFGFDMLKDDLELDMIGLKGSPTNVYKSFTKELKGAGTVLRDLTAEQAVEAIVKKLEEKFII